ncbi:MAG TPA: hypothetical protein VGE52_18655, partial [Pirellulales bacterium]
MDRSPVGMTWARRVGFAAALGWNVWLAQPIAAQTPDAAEPVPAARPSRILGTLQKFRPPQRTLVVLRPDAEGVWREEEV